MSHSFPSYPHVTEKPSLPAWQVFLLLVFFVIIVVGLSYLTFSGVRNLVADAPLGASGEEEVPQAAGQGGIDSDFGDQDTLQAGWNEGRVTVLLLGIDERKFEAGPARTDTMILLTLDLDSGTAGMLSIPRDLWVEIPDYGVYDRINTAFFRGEADQYPGGGGAALARRTIQQNLGIDVPYFVSVNFQAFVQVIDQIGCIPITVPQTIDDPNYPAADGYGYDPFYLEAGQYCMGGETLLKYARTRATFGGDFDRAARQQQVLRAIREHVLSSGELTALMGKAPQIYETVQAGVRTNLSLQQLIDLARIGAEVQEEHICSAVIDGEFIDPQSLADGSQVLVPDRARVRALILEMWTGTGRCDPAVRGLAEQAQAENATVALLNGTQREGLATQTQESLIAAGINIITIQNADRQDYSTTTITNYNGKDATARYLAFLLGVPESAIVAGSPNPALDIQVILGANYQP